MHECKSWKLDILLNFNQSLSTKDLNNDVTDDKFLKIVKNITSKGFVRSNYEEKLVDLSDIRLNLKSKN